MTTRKADCDPDKLRPKVLKEIQAITPSNSVTYYTDGSVDPNTGRCGAAIVVDNGETNHWRVSDGCSTLQTELAAVLQALEHAQATDRQTIVIHTDSKGALDVLQRGVGADNVFLQTSIEIMITRLHQRDRKTIIHWIPSHINTPGNTLADDAAKAATRRGEITIPVTPSMTQIRSASNKRTRIMAQEEHSNLIATSASAKWYYLTTRYEPISFPTGAHRRVESIIHRLRLGYPCGWQVLGDNVRRDRQCRLCGEQPPQPLQHYLIECASTAPIRIDLRPPLTPERVVRHITNSPNPTRIRFLLNHPPPGTI
ncbi:uncharacterized protein LOC143020456 [Oratosquilla oratoria]|uniref:uncharacterized protein LOC143020456 n=1 Tax=Oratosquilla oratoria TaxID=337810 RepID=UPI003F7581EA